MLLELVRAVFDKSHRGDDRAREAASSSPDKPPVLRRSTVRIMAAVGIGVVLYGSLMPFGIAPDRTLDWTLAWQPCNAGDIVANILVYVPLGLCLRLLCRRRGSSRVFEYLASLSLAAALSYLTEVAQTVIAQRVPSWSDAICNLTGASVGVMLAPHLQNALRNLHGWLHRKLREEPLAAAAAAATVCLCAYALLPFDIHPTPAHVGRSIAAFESRLALPPIWSVPVNTGMFGAPSQWADKLAAAGAYGLLAFLLTLAGREQGRSLVSAGSSALARVVALAAAVEGVQLFTISHVADPRDLAAAWLCALLGMGAGLAMEWHIPALHRRPGLVMRGLSACVAIGLCAWAAASIAGGRGGENPSLAPVELWPGLGSFHRPWNSLFADYVTGLLQYTIVAGLVALWCRSTRRGGRPGIIALVTLGVAAGSLIVRLLIGHPLDTTQLLLAGLAVWMVSRLDAAVFGRSETADDSPSARAARIDALGHTAPLSAGIAGSSAVRPPSGARLSRSPVPPPHTLAHARPNPDETAVQSGIASAAPLRPSPSGANRER
jgi:VanZ family protein